MDMVYTQEKKEGKANVCVKSVSSTCCSGTCAMQVVLAHINMGGVGGVFVRVCVCGSGWVWCVRRRRGWIGEGKRGRNKIKIKIKIARRMEKKEEKENRRTMKWRGERKRRLGGWNWGR